MSPEWRRTWARLSIFRDGASGRYRLYSVEESRMEGPEHRSSATKQPPDGYPTLEAARTALAEADPAQELGEARKRGLQEPTPVAAIELESVRACGDPRRGDRPKADPGTLPEDIRRAFLKLAAGIERLPGNGGGIRIILSRTRTDLSLLKRGTDNVGSGGAEEAVETIDGILAGTGLTTGGLIARLRAETRGATGAERAPARTMWNAPRLVVCGAPAAVAGARAHVAMTRDGGGPIAAMAKERPGLPPGRTLNDALVDPDTYARGVSEGWNDVELYRLIVRQIQRSFHAGTHADRGAMLANRPRTTGTKWDAVIGAVIEHAAITHGYDPPAWAEEPERFIEEPTAALTPLPGDAAACQPGPFTRRGVMIDPRDLDDRAGDGRNWMLYPFA